MSTHPNGNKPEELPILTECRNQIKQRQDKVDCLEKVVSTISQYGSFDNLDKERVATELASASAELAVLLNYEQNVLMVQKSLNERMVVIGELAESTGLEVHAPELFKYFLDKQVALHKPCQASSDQSGVPA